MRKRKKIDGIVAGVLLYWIAFVVVAWVVFCVKDAIPDTLVQVGLGGGAVELVATAAIEILSNRRRDEAAGCDRVDIDSSDADGGRGGISGG